MGAFFVILKGLSHKTDKKNYKNLQFIMEKVYLLRFNASLR
jgi:hypothetical protein